MEYNYNKTTKKIINSAFKVSNTLGSGLLEKVYENDYMHLNWHKSLALKLLKENNIEYKDELIEE